MAEAPERLHDERSVSKPTVPIVSVRAAPAAPGMLVVAAATMAAVSTRPLLGWISVRIHLHQSIGYSLAARDHWQPSDVAQPHMNTPATHRYQFLTFDVYTALVDVEGSLAPALRQGLPPHVDALDLVRTWRRKQLEYALISNSLLDARLAPDHEVDDLRGLLQIL
jgi:hypothetical protein